MNKSTLMTLIGAGLMGGGGSSITTGLGLTGWRQVNVALFAIGIIFLAQAPFLSLRARIQKLEAESKPAAAGN